jgi:hypothetical protein
VAAPTGGLRRRPGGHRARVPGRGQCCPSPPLTGHDGGTPIGLGLGSYDAVDVTLPEAAALFSDGLVETRAKDIDDGLRRLASVLEQEPSRDLAGLCERAVERMVPGGTTEDDAALLLAGTRAPGAGR